MIEVPSRKTFSMAIDPESVHAGSEKDEDCEVPLLSRSCQKKGPAMIMTYTLPAEVTGRQTSGWEPVLVSTEAIPSSSFQGQEMSIDPVDIHPSSSVEIMQKVPEQSSIAGLIGAELPL